MGAIHYLILTGNYGLTDSHFFKILKGKQLFGISAGYGMDSVFGPLEMDDVIGLVRLPEFLCGTSHVNTCHSDSITQYRYEQIARISVFSKDDERCYRRTACIFTVIHVFLF